MLDARTRLLRTLSRALDLASSAIPHLATMANQPGTSASFRREKFISETALLLHACSLVADAPGAHGDRIGRLARELAPHARSALMLTAMMIRPVVASELAVAHACLTHLGLPDPGFQAAVEGVLDDPAATFLERLPWKDLEARWSGALLRPGAEDGESPRQARILAEVGLDAIAATRKEMYAFTHGLIYLSGFGARTPCLMRSPHDVAADAECALAASIDDDDFDLASELLMTWPYLRLHWPNAARFCLSVMNDIEDEVGFLPSLSISHQEYVRTPIPDRDRYFFLESYHTIYVGALLASACLARDHPPPDRLDECAFGADPRPILALMTTRPRPSRWEMSYAALPAGSQAVLAPLVANIAIRRAIVSGDLGRLKAILEVVLRCEYPASATVTQAVALYLRFADSPASRFAAIGAS